MTITVPLSLRSKAYVITGVETSLDYTWPILAASDIVVVRLRGGDETTLIMGADYLVTEVGQQAGGSIVAATVPAPWIAGDVIVIEGDLRAERAANLIAARAFTADALNAEFNRLWIASQELKREVSRAIRLSGAETGAPDVKLPEDRAGKALWFDEFGNVIAVPGGGGGGGDLDFPLSIELGGSGGATVEEAQENLGINAANSTGTPQLQDGAVTEPKLANNAVINRTIADGAVNTAELADRGVTLAKQALGPANQLQGWDVSGQPAAVAPLVNNKVVLLGQSRLTGGALVRYFVTADNSLWAVGDATNKQNGTDADTDLPLKVVFNVAPGKITKVVCGPKSTYVLDASGRVYSFGGNASGQLGHGDTAARPVATRIEFFVSGGIIVADVIPAAGGRAGTNDYVYFISSTGAVYSCGGNANGNLGLGDLVQRSAPVLVPGLPSIAKIAAGCFTNSHALAVAQNGTLWGCGYNGEGQLGLGDATQRTAFVQVPSFTGAIDALAVSSSSNANVDGYSLVLKGDGSIWSAGVNSSGQLGLGDTADRSVFLPVVSAKFFTQIHSVAGRNGFIAALTSDGEVWLWGNGSSGNLGNAATTNSSVPFRPTGAFQGKVVRIALCGEETDVPVNKFSAFVVTSDNEVWATGNNESGQLGLGDVTQRTVFTKLAGLAGPVADLVASGSLISVTPSFGITVLHADGTVTVAGDNSKGQLGLGTGSVQDGLVLREVWPLSRMVARDAAVTKSGVPWFFSDATSMSDPGAGMLRLNNAALASVTAIALSELCAETGNPNVSGFLTTWGASTNPGNKGTLLISKISAPQNFVSLQITGGPTDGGAWQQAPVTVLASSGAFVAGDFLSVQFFRAGDAASSPGTPSSVQVFTANGTWTKPAGLTRVRIRVIGPGGGGGGASGAAANVGVGAGGGSGAYVERFMAAGALAATEAVTVGLGGLAGANTGAAGGNGSASSSFGAHASAGPGLGGAGQTGGAAAALVAPGAGGTATGGAINAAGEPGTFGNRISGTLGSSGQGGSSVFGGGGRAVTGSSAGQPGSAPGAGGGGAATNSSTNQAGGPGADGIVIVEEFY